MHSFFLHRYATHGQFSMGRRTERLFYFLTWFFQGPAFLDPTAYAKLHLEHHAHSDTKEDPHSPLNFSHSKFGLDVAVALPKMMWYTKKIYVEIRDGKSAIAKLYRERTFPTWYHFEKFSNSYIAMVITAFIIIACYALFAPVWWCWLLLPLSLLNGPVQGAIVNWCGHMWGYRNFKLADNSRNTPILGTLMLGECFQNNHHQYPQSPNFAKRWFEFDPIYPVIMFFSLIRIIKIAKN